MANLTTFHATVSLWVFNVCWNLNSSRCVLWYKSGGQPLMHDVLTPV